MRTNGLSILMSGLALVLGGVALRMSSVAEHRIADYGAQPSYVPPEAVRTALMADPEMIVDAVNKLKADKIAATAQADRTLVDSARAELLAPGRGDLGNPDGTHVAVEFFDYQCAHCRDARAGLNRAIGLDPQLRVIQREIAVLGPGSVLAAKAALAAAHQGLYVRMRDAMMTSPTPVDDDDVAAAAKGIGADLPRLRADMASASVEAELQANASLSRRVGVVGTPSFAVPGHGLMTGFPADPRAFVSYVSGAGR